MSIPPDQLSAQQTAVYRGASQAEALQQFALDAQRAHDGGYLPTGQDWSDEGGQHTLTVRYSRSSVPSTNPTWGILPPPPVVPAAAKKPSRKIWVAMGAVILVVIAATAVGGGTKDPGTGSDVATNRPATVASDADRWAEFVDWTVDAMPSMADDLRAVSETAGVYDIAGIKRASRTMAADATSALQYLSSHPAADCYAGVQADLEGAMTAFRNSADAMISADYATGLVEMTNGSDLLSDATAGIPAAKAACAS